MPQVFDGEFEIVYSGEYIIYENRLVLNPLVGYKFELIFEKDKGLVGSNLNIVGDNVGKSIVIKATNFDNTLGTGTTKKIAIIKDNVGNDLLFFSLHAKSLNESTSFLLVNICFYRRPQI